MCKAFRREQVFQTMILIGLLALIVIIFSQKIKFTSIDLGRHLANGRLVWQDPSLLYHNFYSYTEPDAPFVNHHWLSGVIFYLVYSLGGFKWLSVFNILLILGAFGLVFRLAQKRAGFYLTALLAIPTIFLLSERVEIRPEVFSYLFIFLTWFLLDQTSRLKNYRRLWLLVPLFILWANIHIYFFFGLALLGFQAAAEFIYAYWVAVGRLGDRFKVGFRAAKPWLKIFAACFVACLANPNFIKGVLYPLNIFRNYGYEIAENKTVFYLEHLLINYNFAIFKWLLFLLLLSWAAYFVFRREKRWFDALVSIFFAALALFASRNLAIFGLVALVIVSANLAAPVAYLKENSAFFQKLSSHRSSLWLAGFILALTILAIAYLLQDATHDNNFLKSRLGWGLAAGSEDSIRFFKANNLSGPIFNDYDIGSTLIFWLYPQEKVFVDNRPEAYSQEFFASVYRPMQTDYKVWKEAMTRYRFKVIYFAHTDSTPWARAFLASILKDQDWALVYFDRQAVILLDKKQVAPEIWQKLVLDDWSFRSRLRLLAADSDLRSRFSLADLAELAGQDDLAEEVYRDLLFQHPGNGQILAALGFLYSNKGNEADFQLSLSYFNRALGAGYVLPGVYNQMGLVKWSLRDYETAEKYWQKALGLDRTNSSALYYLNQIDSLRRQGELPFK